MAAWMGTNNHTLGLCVYSLRAESCEWRTATASADLPFLARPPPRSDEKQPHTPAATTAIFYFSRGIKSSRHLISTKKRCAAPFFMHALFPPSSGARSFTYVYWPPNLHRYLHRESERKRHRAPAAPPVCRARRPNIFYTCNLLFREIYSGWLKLKGRSEINCLAAAEARSKHFPARAMCIMHSAPAAKMLFNGSVAAAACVVRAKSHHEFVIYIYIQHVCEWECDGRRFKGRCAFWLSAFSLWKADALTCRLLELSCVFFGCRTWIELSFLSQRQKKNSSDGTGLEEIWSSRFKLGKIPLFLFNSYKITRGV